MGGKGNGSWKSDFNDPQSFGMAEFLKLLPEDEILPLVKTTTGGLICPEDLNEAIEVIINFSDAVSLLNRRRVKKEYLVKYLVSKKLSFSLQADKTKLCHLVLKLWGQVQGQQLKFEDYESKENDVPASSSAEPARRTTRSSAKTTESSVKVEEQPPSSIATVFQEAEDLEDTEMEVAVIDPQQTSAEAQSGQQLAFQFAEWFYSRLNKLEDFTSEHFWFDCNFRLQVGSGSNLIETNIRKDGGQVCSLLRSLVAEQGCFFNPNTLNGIGIRGTINPHGLAQVMVCGTVHRGAVAAGIFEQLFGLMKDPSTDNNFKIKFSVLRLQEQSARQLQQ